MNRVVAWRLYCLCGIVLISASQGCSHCSSSTTRISQESWRADLDECLQVRLSRDLVWDHMEGEPERKYEQLTLEVRPREHLKRRCVVKKVELKSGMSRGQLDLDEVTIRADRNRRKVWFVERDTGRIIATLDVATGVTTGPDDAPPSWATSDGGDPLYRAE